MVYTIESGCIEVPELSYDDGVKIYYFNTEGTKGGNEELKVFLNYLENSVSSNAVNEATREAELYVDYIKDSQRIEGDYMTWGDYFDWIIEELLEQRMKEMTDEEFNELVDRKTKEHSDKKIKELLDERTREKAERKMNELTDEKIKNMVKKKASEIAEHKLNEFVSPKEEIYGNQCVVDKEEIFV